MRMKLKSEICNDFLMALGKDDLLFSSGSDSHCAPSHLQKWTNTQFLVPLFWNSMLHSSALCGYQIKQAKDTNLPSQVKNTNFSFGGDGKALAMQWRTCPCYGELAV